MSDVDIDLIDGAKLNDNSAIQYVSLSISLIENI